MAQSSSSNKVSNGLLSASFAAVLAVYAAGYVRTQAAADRFASKVAERRVADRQPMHLAVPGNLGLPMAPSVGVIPSNTPAGMHPRQNVIAKITPAAKVEAPQASLQTVPSEPVVATPTPAAPAVIVVESKAPVVEAKPEAAPAPAPTWKDGTYTGWGYSRHGDIEAAVVIASGRIISASITKCYTRYSCDVIDRLPPQVAQRQSPDVDYVSGATQSADAFYGAVFEALKKAK